MSQMQKLFSFSKDKYVKMKFKISSEISVSAADKNLIYKPTCSW